MSPDFWTFVKTHLANGESLFLAHVAHNTRHSPGTTGAQLAVRHNGATFGTIGGGVMEAQVLEMAQTALAASSFSARYERLYHRRNAPKDGGGRTSGLGCAGNQTNVYHLVTPDRDLEIVNEIAARKAADRPGMVRLSEAGLKLEEVAPEQIEAPLRFQDGQDWCLSLQLLNWKRIAIVGGGHCGFALSRQMHHLGYTVTVIDDRPDVFTFCSNDYADHRIAVDDYARAGDAIDHPHLTHVVVMTANASADIRALSGLAEGPYPYLGVMGAPAKLARIRRDLIEMGIASEAIDKLYAPIGVKMTSNTPEEIAVSIAAEILQEREVLFPFTASPGI